MDSAYLNGFSPFSTGCHVIIADGLKGTDETYVPVEGGEYIKEAKIGTAIMDADVLISLTHFKGHENTGFGGALKNIGMGCGSRAGKMRCTTRASRASIRSAAWVARCARAYARMGRSPSRTARPALTIPSASAAAAASACARMTPSPAITTSPTSSSTARSRVHKAVVDGRPCFHIALVIDVSPNCDCHAENDVPIVPNVGMFASFDPVALDQACADAVNQMPANPHSALFDHDAPKAEDAHDHFHAAHPETNWQSALEHGEKIGIGTRQYTLIRI